MKNIPLLLDKSIGGDGFYVRQEMVDIHGYKMLGWPKNYFDYVFDIGAHIGYFSYMMRILHSEAKIIALEPGPIAFDCLQSNLKSSNVIMINKAIGDGNLVGYHQDLNLLGTSYCDIKSDFKVPTITFIDLFKESGCTKHDKYFIKSDCEGGEKHILLHEEHEGVLINAVHLGFEVHFNAPDPSTNGKDWLDYPVYNEWIQKVLSTTHEVEYFRSRKRYGLGHYSIISKKHCSQKSS